MGIAEERLHALSWLGGGYGVVVREIDRRTVQCEVNLELTNRLRQVMRAQRAATGR